MSNVVEAHLSPRRRKRNDILSARRETRKQHSLPFVIRPRVELEVFRHFIAEQQVELLRLVLRQTVLLTEPVTHNPASIKLLADRDKERFLPGCASEDVDADGTNETARSPLSGGQQLRCVKTEVTAEMIKWSQFRVR